MKRTLRLIAAGLLLAALGLPQICAAQAPVSEQTRKHLEEAMQGEAYEYLLYQHYAQWAELSGYPEVAKAFRAVAESESKVHFAREAAAYGLVHSNIENLQSAMKDELEEQIKFNAKYADAARAAGDAKVAAMFAQIASEEKEHYAVLKKALDDLKADPASR